MSYQREAVFGAIREVAFGDITESYVALGDALSGYPRVVRFVNSTDKDMYISTDGDTNHIKLRTGSEYILNLATNQIQEQGWYLSKGTQFYIKYEAEPSSGAVWIELVEGSASQP